MSTPTFGKLNASQRNAVPQVAPEQRRPPIAPGDEARPNEILAALDRIFVRVPNEKKPGVLALLVFFGRQIVFSGLAMVVLLIGFMGLIAPDRQLQDPRFSSFAPILISGPLVFFEELGRYAFVRRAENPMRALIVFTVATALVCAVNFRDNLYTVAWSTAATAAASATLYWGLGHRRYVGWIIATLIAAHTAVYVIAPQLSSAKATSRPAASSLLTPEPSENLAPTAPAVGGMPSWARLYPGATIVRSKADKMLGLTSWKVSYAVQASPEQIDTFYQQAARDAGFSDDGVLVGLHTFRQRSTNNDFNYMVWKDPHGQLVMFQARTFGQPPTPAAGQ